MKYYKLVYDYEHDDRYINCIGGNIGGMNEYIVSSGTYMTDWEIFKLKYDSAEGDIMSDYAANVYGWLMISNTLCELLLKSDIKANLQFLPVELVDVSSGNINDSYKVVNILDVIDAIDLKHSKYDVFKLDSEKIIMVEKFALKEEVVKDYDIFRLKNDTIPIFVSEKIKRLIKKNKLSGFVFREVPVY